MEPEELERAVEAVLFAAGEPVELKRLSQALGCETGEVQEDVYKRQSPSSRAGHSTKSKRKYASVFSAVKSQKI